MTNQPLRFEVVEQITLVTCATPPNLNGITAARLDEIAAMLTKIECDEDLGAMILTGEGKAF